VTYSILIFVSAMLGTAGVLLRTIRDHQVKILDALEGVALPPDAPTLGSRPVEPRQCAAF
jgi:hypothetical protein